MVADCADLVEHSLLDGAEFALQLAGIQTARDVPQIRGRPVPAPKHLHDEAQRLTRGGGFHLT